MELEKTNQMNALFELIVKHAYLSFRKLELMKLYLTGLTIRARCVLRDSGNERLAALSVPNKVSWALWEHALRAAATEPQWIREKSIRRQENPGESY